MEKPLMDDECEPSVLRANLSAARLRIAELEATIVIQTQRREIQLTRQLESESLKRTQNTLKNVLDLLSTHDRLLANAHKVHEDLKATLMCGICMEVRAQPRVLVDCGHTMCHVCLKNLLQRVLRCPFCNTRVQSPIVPNLLILGVLDRLPWLINDHSDAERAVRLRPAELMIDRDNREYMWNMSAALQDAKKRRKYLTKQECLLWGQYCASLEDEARDASQISRIREEDAARFDEMAAEFERDMEERDRIDLELEEPDSDHIEFEYDGMISG